MTFFRVLPTDQRYLNLNLFQKLILLSQIGKYKEEKFNLSKMMLDQVKLYLNPAMLRDELGMGSTGTKGYERVNKDFTKQAASGRMTGHVKLSTEMEAAIKEYNEKKKDPNRQYLYINPKVVENRNDEELG